MPGKLYLIPSDLCNSDIHRIQPEYNVEVINSITTYIVENERTARRFLIKAGIKTKIDDLTFFILNKHTKPDEIHQFLAPIKDKDIGILSEAGTPCVADPGSEIVKIAQQKNITVVPLIGANSMILALMASGLNGQSFAFNGYLPVKPNERVKSIKFYEQRSKVENQTQLFIEAPYRNNQLLKDLLQSLQGGTMLTIAVNITGEDEMIKTKTAGEWKKQKIDLHKHPAIFLFKAN